MTIRAAHPSDFEILAEIWEASVRATHTFLHDADIRALRPRVESEYLPALAVCVYVDADGVIQGFVGVAEAKIEMLFIAPAARGRGVGKALLGHAVSAMSAERVDVNEQNPQAVGFYQHLGFEMFDRSPLDGQGNPFPLLHLRRSRVAGNDDGPEAVPPPR